MIIDLSLLPASAHPARAFIVTNDPLQQFRGKLLICKHLSSKARIARRPTAAAPLLCSHIAAASILVNQGIKQVKVKE